MGLLHLDLRAWTIGGPVATSVQVFDEDGLRLSHQQFSSLVSQKHLVLVTHGFNVRHDEGLGSLEGWKVMAQLGEPFVFVGLLWPGDSLFLPLLDYPLEGAVAMQAAGLLAPFLVETAAGASAISMVSHSLGARVLLETTRRGTSLRVDTLVLMAGAIEDNCLADEYRDVVANLVRRVVVVASRGDKVLQFAFPLGNPIGELLMRGHPYFRQALGRQGAFPLPSSGPLPEHWQIPDAPSDWDYGHHNYMPDNSPPAGWSPAVSLPLRHPASSDQLPPPGTDLVKSEWAARVVQQTLDPR